MHVLKPDLRRFATNFYSVCRDI